MGIGRGVAVGAGGGGDVEKGVGGGDGEQAIKRPTSVVSRAAVMFLFLLVRGSLRVAPAEAVESAVESDESFKQEPP